MDRILASRLGVAAMDRLLAGEHNCMLGEVNGSVVSTPFAEAIGKQKKLQDELVAMVGILAT